jgi:putative endonuclease
MATDRRRELGALGEHLAREHLAAHGYELLERNFRTRYGEIDVVARTDDFLVFCEVKTRVTHPRPGPFTPFSAVGSRKRRQLRKIAAQWLAQRERVGGSRPGELRFDAIGVTVAPDGALLTLEHLENAF